MDRGTPALIGWLALVSLLLIVVASLAAALFVPNPDHTNWGFFEFLWENLMRVIDPGAIAGDTGPGFRALMLGVAVGGIMVFSALIGVLTTGLDNRIAELRKGRSRVIERNHVVLLGWSDQVLVVISELVKANQGGKRTSVVVLSDRDKVEMEDEIKDRVGDLGRLRVICRSGSPLKRADLELTNLDSARSIMVMLPATDEADIDVIKVLLLLNNRSWGPGRPHVVAAVQDSHDVAAARLAGGPDAIVIDADDIAVRLVAQSHRQSGLSTVCTDLLDFSGNEIYMRSEPSLAGIAFGDAIGAFDLGCPIGLHHADGSVSVNPPMETLIKPDDRLILIAEDDLLIRLAAERSPIDGAAITNEPTRAEEPDRTLLVGWNTRAPRILDLLDRLVEPKSIVDIAALTEPAETLAVRRDNLTVGFKRCDTTNRRSLEELDLGTYHHVIVLADDGMTPDHADDRTLVTLLHLRDIEVKLGDPFSIITEINDDENREVAQVTKADDFIVSTMLISLLMTQLAENKHLQGVFTELFDPEGSEIQLKPAREYVAPGTAVTFATVAEAARRRGHTPIGYRTWNDNAEPPSYGVVLNPPKATILTLSAADSVIVIAES